MSTTIFAILIVIVAGFLQGTFILPMTYTKKWEWAHNWFAFSILGMVLVNWLIAYFTIDNIFGIISHVSPKVLITVLFFGLAWGAGAILFGKAMDLLGMALGYPVIMGINAVAGTIIPAIIYSPQIFTQDKGIMIIAGTVISVVGIILCTNASKMRSVDASTKTKFSSIGLVLAVISGFTSCLPNIGASFSTEITDLAVKSGVNSIFAGNVVWSLFFSMGALVNAGYCLFIIIKKKSQKQLVNEFKVQNWLLILAMSSMWMGSFYFYGFGSAMLGNLGLIVGWPLLVSLSIVIGNLWGLFRGEWTGANKKARNMLNLGLWVLVFSTIIIAMSNIF